MANLHRHHRLERLFSLRKSPSTHRLANTQEPPEPTFPQASFIRPKSSRMMAREEVGMTTPSPTKRSLCSNRSSLPTSLTETDLLRDSNFEASLRRAGSLLERREVTMPELQVLRHSSQISQPTGDLPASPTSIPFSTSENTAASDRGARPKAAMRKLQRLDTPPASDPEDSFSMDLDHTSIQSSAPPHIGLPTPGPSPDMSPVSDTFLDGSPDAIRELNSSNSVETAEEGAAGAVPPTTEDLSPERHDENVPSHSAQSAILKEPTLDDFMHLSDDDIAEEQTTDDEMESQIQSQTLPPTPVSLASGSRAVSSLTLPSPFYSRPAAVAAFEAARIAARHHFDLIYVVNLWPEAENGRDPRSTPTKWSHQAGGSKGRMMGRFLAAYGLSTVQSPFQISTMVHRQILQTDGWIEYQNDEAEPDDFARGYACAFYRGQHGGPHAPSGLAGSSAAPKPEAETIDRGIVFAAYRKPSRDGDKSAVNCSQEQLSSIYRDAETLVEMLIDVHMADRLRSSPEQLHYSDETGPMPMHRPVRGT